MGLIRQVLWVPDGKPPESWSEAREVSVLKIMLHQGRNFPQLEAAILGLAQLRDTGQIEWLKPGQKVTTRALYHTRSGVNQMFELATTTYWRAAKRPPHREAAERIGHILWGVLAQSTEYREYLRSPEWRARRKRALIAAAYRCQRCHHVGGGLDVHHLSYAHFGAGTEPDEDLEVVCRDCHNVLHGRISQPRPGAPF